MVNKEHAKEILCDPQNKMFTICPFIEKICSSLTDLIKDLYLEHVRYFYDSLIRRQTIQLKNGHFRQHANLPPPHSVHGLIPEICGYSILHGIRDVADVIKVIDFNIGILSSIIWVILI